MGKFLFVILFVGAVVIGGPIASILALNTLFPTLAIPVTIETWFASFWLTSILGSSIVSTKAK